MIEVEKRGWRRVKLGEVCVFKTGKLNSNAATVNGPYPFFTCSQETYRTDTYSFDTEAIILGGNNANGIYPIKYFKGKFDAYQRTYVIKALDKAQITNRYLFYNLKLKLNLLQRVSTGVTTKFLTLTILKHLEVLIPPLPSQRKIAAILSAYDDLIENNTRGIKILEEMAQTIYKEWFVKFRFPGYEKVKMVDSELGKIPEGWMVKPSSQVLEINPRISVNKESEKPFVFMEDVSNTSMVIRCRTKKEGLSGSKFQNGDIVFARITPSLENGKIGFVQFLSSDNEVGLGSTEFIVLRSKHLCPEYVYLLARTEKFRGNAIKSMIGASGRQRVQEACFDHFFLAVPPPSKTERFHGYIAPIFKNIHLLSLKNGILRRTRDLLLPKLISGEIDVEDIDIEQLQGGNNE